jgi:hypothetical protein
MIEVRKGEDRGHLNHGWLDTYHTFSFGDYYDPRHMAYRSLRVINEDVVAPGQGFGTHPHRDMEIITYVLEGALEHRDSMGNHGVIRPGEVQRMSAGTGVRHSEQNPSNSELVHFLQIWLVPSVRNVPPSYEQKTFAEADKRGRLKSVATPDGRDGSVTIHADARLYAGLFDAAESAELPLAPGRHAWVQLARGRARVNGTDMETGDGLALSDETSVRIERGSGAEVLVFDLG